MRSADEPRQPIRRRRPSGENASDVRRCTSSPGRLTRVRSGAPLRGWSTTCSFETSLSRTSLASDFPSGESTGITKESKRPIKTFRRDPPELRWTTTQGPDASRRLLSRPVTTWVGGHSSALSLHVSPGCEADPGYTFHTACERNHRSVGREFRTRIGLIFDDEWSNTESGIRVFHRLRPPNSAERDGGCDDDQRSDHKRHPSPTCRRRNSGLRRQRLGKMLAYISEFVKQIARGVYLAVASFESSLSIVQRSGPGTD
jgi:hypothetical protein